MASLWPPHEKLKGGIDLVGGTSLLFEIDTTGLPPEKLRGLSTRVMEILKDRVDPNGQLNLEWRPVGNTRLEIRMPRPPKGALARRVTYNQTLDRLAALNLRRYDVESALSAEGEERTALLDGLTRGVDERTGLVATLVFAYDAYSVAQAGDVPGAADTARSTYEDSMRALLATSLPVSRATDVLALKVGPIRDAQLAKLTEEFPSYDAGHADDASGKLLTKVVEAYDAWARNKADLEDPSDLKRLLRGAGVLEFRILADRNPTNPSMATDPNNLQIQQPIAKYTDQLGRYGPRAKAGDRFLWCEIDDVVDFMHLDSLADFEIQQSLPGQPIVEEYAGSYYVLAHNDPEYGLLQGKGGRGWSLREAYPDRNQLTGQNVVAFRLDPRGGALFGELTGNNLKRSLCIMLDNVAMSSATIQSRITERGQITGRFTAETVQEMVRTFEAGSLPARVKETPLMENTIGPSLGETNRKDGIFAAIVGTIAVGVFIVFYYGIAAGGMANIALALNLLFVLGVMAMLQATFTLPGIAGLILTVGMAVDANVLIFERIREERARGVIFKRALNAGYDKAFSTIVDANITTLLTCVILGFVGSEEIKGFAITLGIGITTSLFTSLFVTRLAFNTLIQKGWLSDLSMRHLIGTPTIDWMALRRKFWPVSLVSVVLGLALFLGLSSTRTELMFGIEFLGGTSLQVDMKPGLAITDDEMADAITSRSAPEGSAVQWLTGAADQLGASQAGEGELPGQLTLTSQSLTGDQLWALMRTSIEDDIERGTHRVTGHTLTVDSKPGILNLESFQKAVVSAAEHAKNAALRLAGARVQSVGDRTDDEGRSFEIVTIETDRELVQAAILAPPLGPKLSVQRGITFSTIRDDELTMEPFFVVEAEDHYLSDVIGGKAKYDIRRFRGGAAFQIVLDATQEPITIAQFEKRIREVGLQPEFEQFRTRESAIFPLGEGASPGDGGTAYRSFAVLAIDESLLYDDDRTLWTDEFARPHLNLVEAALGREKSLSKVIQFAPQIAGQAQNKAVLAILLALGTIVAYLWLRFGTKEYGLAAIVALVHDVAITLGLIGVSQLVFNTFLGKALALDGFRIDLPMIAAILTVIGYSLNDTIVVFDRIRENKGRIESLSPRIINTSINQTLSRTLLTSLTTLLVVGVLYVFGGQGVHGFSFALLIGVVVGTYSSIGVATPLLYRPRLLHAVVMVMVAAAVIGVILLATGDNPTTRWVLVGLTVAGCFGVLVKARQPVGHPTHGGHALPA